MKRAKEKRVLVYEEISHSLDAIAILLQSMAAATERDEIVEAEKALYELSHMVLEEIRNAKALFETAYELQKA